MGAADRIFFKSVLEVTFASKKETDAGELFFIFRKVFLALIVVSLISYILSCYWESIRDSLNLLSGGSCILSILLMLILGIYLAHIKVKKIDKKKQEKE